jgi:hypothetical protein
LQQGASIVLGVLDHASKGWRVPENVDSGFVVGLRIRFSYTNKNISILSIFQPFTAFFNNLRAFSAL